MNGIRRCKLIGTLLATLLGLGGCATDLYRSDPPAHDAMMEYETSRLRYRVTAFLHYLDHARGPTLDYLGHLDFYEESDDIVAGLMLRGYYLQFKKPERSLSDRLRELRTQLRELEIEHRNLTCAQNSPACEIRVTLECRTSGDCATEQPSSRTVRPAQTLQSCRRCQSQSRGQTQPQSSGCQPKPEAARYVSSNGCSQLITCPQPGNSNCALDAQEIAERLAYKLKEIDSLLWTL